MFDMLCVFVPLQSLDGDMTMTNVSTILEENPNIAGDYICRDDHLPQHTGWRLAVKDRLDVHSRRT